MAQMNSNMATGITQQQQTQRAEQARQIERQQERMDHITDSALEYTTRNNQISQQQPAPAAAVERVCPKCGTAVAGSIRFCHHCGTDLK
jgi:rubrerythrin